MKLKIFIKNVRKDGLKANAPNNESLLKFTKKIIEFSEKGLKKRKIKEKRQE